MRHNVKFMVGEFTGVDDVERDITKVGFDDNFEPIKFQIPTKGVANRLIAKTQNTS
jgi:hypothetical protein